MKVLIAEDDQFIRQGLKELIEPEGYQCLLARDGEEAVKLFETEDVDLLLLDIMMPGLDGYSVCKYVRKINEDIPIIFITAKSEEIDQVLGLELGADDYIKKPFGTREVIARIRAVTRRRLRQIGTVATPVSDVLVMGEIKVFCKELRAMRGNVSIDLSLRDIQILKLLWEKKGQVVDRDSLFNRVWGRGYLPSSRTLDQHISKLRKLIETNPKAPKIIKTVHGVGYRFDDMV